MIFLGEFSFLFSDSSISGEGLYPPAQAAPKGQTSRVSPAGACGAGHEMRLGRNTKSHENV